MPNNIIKDDLQEAVHSSPVLTRKEKKALQEKQFDEDSKKITKALTDLDPHLSLSAYRSFGAHGRNLLKMKIKIDVVIRILQDLYISAREGTTDVRRD